MGWFWKRRVKGEHFERTLKWVSVVSLLMIIIIQIPSSSSKVLHEEREESDNTLSELVSRRPLDHPSLEEQLLDSFPQVKEEEGHKTRHHHHHRHRHGEGHSRKRGGGHNHHHPDASYSHEINPPTLQNSLQTEDLLPLFPKNVSEETALGLKRLKRQFQHLQGFYDDQGNQVDRDPYGRDRDPYGRSSPGRDRDSAPRYYVTADGTEWRDDGRGESEWSAASPCSRPCGGGVAFQERICRDPHNPDGLCNTGESNRRYFSCATHPCPGIEEDFRAEQCAAFNTVPFEGRFYQWIPYTKAPNKCELNCMPQGERFYYRHKRQVIDGTRCDEEGREICVEGRCLSVGCDNILGSRAREDKCRKCGGDGVGCHTVQGLFDNNQNLQVGYNDVLLIPMGATNILVKEKRASNNYLAIRNTSNHYYLNGNWRIDFPRELAFANTIFHYERKPHSFFAPESIRALGPISEALYIVVLYQESNPGIEYEYSISDKENQIALTTPGSYYWIYDDFSPCSESCGGGFQQRYVYCAKRTEESIEYVEDYLCDMTNKPQTQQMCNTHACPLRWYEGAWEGCSAKCGTNETGVQYRTVFCEQSIQGSSAIVNDESRCEHEVGRRPPNVQACTGEVEGGICASWHLAEWSACSSLCGQGEEQREVKCHVRKENVTTLYEDSHCAEAKPETRRPCYNAPCEGVDWISGPWSGCKASEDPCDDTLMPVETRQVYCSSAEGKVFADEFCHEYRKPNGSKDCEAEASEGGSTPASACQYAWFAMQWGECLLKSCTPPEDSGGEVKGVKSRLVFCGTMSAGSVSIVEDESNCNETKTYNSTEFCDLPEDYVRKECFEKSSWFTGPWSKCSKACGAGTRSRQLICMVGNESTTDVKKCGEEGIVFSSEDCTGEDCATGATGEEMTAVTPRMTTDEVGRMEPWVDCEPDYEDEYYYNYELEGSGETTTEEPSTTVSSDDESLVTTEDGASGDGGSGDEPEDLVSSGEEDEGMGKKKKASPKLMSGDEGMEDAGSGSGDEPEADSDSLLSSSTLSSSSDSDETTTPAGDSKSTTGGDGGDETTTEGTASEDETTAGEGDAETTTAGEEAEEEAAPEERRRRRRRRDTEEEETTTADSDTTTASDEGGEETTTAAGDETTTAGDETTAAGDETTAAGDETTTVGDYPDTGRVKEESPPDMSSSGDGSGDDDDGELDDGMIKVTKDADDDMMSSGSGSGSGDDMDGTTSAPRTTLEQALTTEAKLPKCPPRVKPTAEPPQNCTDAPYGCCPNGKDPATGPFSAGCSTPTSCRDTKWGCCPDGVTPAQGKLKIRGCPMPDCETSLFGCCPDGKTSAGGNDFLHCEKPCLETEFGCCPDEKTPKKGPKGKGCPKVKCEDTRYGCCPGEDKAIAEGPGLQGCKEINKKNCSASFFGCCLDGKTAALGNKEEGCPEMPPCVTEEFGCCDDEVTSAHGPNKEGCCLSSDFGCCPDNIQAASGPGLEGCTCKNSIYGCCPDNTTAARGPGGDCGCKFSEHGCCPDGYTLATGANSEGCPCSTFQFGCCPDGEAVAKGPNKEGCGCQFTEFGCCPDKRTPASKKQGEGDDDAACGCESSVFGCCPDGATEAKGEDFEGCEEVPIKPGEVCGLDKERGSCRNFTVKWFFDMEYGGCSRFWYGGCDGNKNRFASQDECKAICVEPEGRDACYLPQVAGPCEGYYPSWYYDPNREMCLQFVYGGCLGNNNRFATRELCENNCLLSDRVDACDQPKTEGPCKGNYTRFYFDKAEEKCTEYQYGGCKGNGNNFLTDRECEQRCSTEGRIRALLDQCTQRPSALSKDCRGGDLIRWYFDGDAGTCLRFNLGDCGGSNANSNVFVSRAQCLGICGNASLPSMNALGTEVLRVKVHNVNASGTSPLRRNSCFLPRQEGPCGEKLARWYYDTHEQRCVPFYFGGCQGNANRFNTLGDCEKSCPAALLAENTCLQPPAVGDCASYTERYFYDPYEGRCKAYVYSGCGGNSNNFVLIDDCRNKCERSFVPQPVVSTPGDYNTAHCFSPPGDHSQCLGSDPTQTQVKWFYDSGDGVCKQFRFYADCDAHKRSVNRFDNRQECEDRCEAAQDLCSLPQVPGPCSGSFPQYYYEASSDSCGIFEYGGCQGNGNRFDSLSQCEQKCKKAQGPPAGHPSPHHPQGPSSPDEEERRRQEYYAEYERQRQEEERRRQEQEAESQTVMPPHTLGQDDICSLPMEVGPCRKSVAAYAYDPRTQRCQAFIYGGCQGNANRFETEEMCERQCGQFRGEDVCRIGSAEPGPCRARIQKWYFNPSSRSCAQFYYGGCQGNGNRFSSREECESVCHSHTEMVESNDTISGAAICRLGSDPGPCTDNHKRWFFDWEQNTCIPYVYGGCAGNLNNFGSFDACLQYCQRALMYEQERDQRGHSEDERERHPPPEAREGHRENEDANRLEECGDQLVYCKTLQCPYGVERSEDEVGCPHCSCNEPCRNFPCREDEQCAVDIVAIGTIARGHGQQSSYGLQHQQAFRAVCRKQVKSGECPSLWSGSSPRIGLCAQECESDADCMDVMKCCSNGCGTSCMLPQGEGGVAAPGPQLPYTPPLLGGESPPRILSTTTEVEAEEGGLANLECLCRGNPQPQISWRFNNAEVAVDSGRFRTLQDGSVLQIVGTYKRDEGVYTCAAENGVGRPATLDITLVVTDPTPHQASIVEEDTEPNVIVSLGSAASLRCFALGWPRPSVTWWKGEKMLPFSSDRYEQMRDYSLLIRLVSLRDLGPYTCQAYNGQGKAASWTVTVQTVGPVSSTSSEDREYLQYVISGGRRPVHGGGQRPGGGPGYGPPRPAIPTIGTTTERHIIPNYLVPLKTTIRLEKSNYPVGADITIPCEAEGYPTPSVHWYKDDSPLISGENERVTIFNGNEVRIENATLGDSGSYRCDAMNEYGSSSSSANIQVEGVYLHPNCTDNPFFANCKLIVKANYCTNKYYARFCCKSCTYAGQLPAYGPHLRDFGQAFFRSGQVEYAPTNMDGSSRRTYRHLLALPNDPYFNIDGLNQEEDQVNQNQVS